MIKLVGLGAALPRITAVLEGMRRRSLGNCLCLHSKISSSWTSAMSELYCRISSITDQNVSIVPFLDQWVGEGRHIHNHKHQLRQFIVELRFNKRYHHALQVSAWMTDKRYFELTPQDVVTRLDLIAKVHGIDQAENYFTNIPQQLKVLKVYSALLNCYAYEKCVKKAEAIMQEMKGLSFAKKSSVYNAMLKFYYQTGNTDKLDKMMQEMNENGIGCDKFAYSIQLNAYAAGSDFKGMEKTLTRMESDPNVVPDWGTYCAMASAYTKVGLLDNALELLRKAEGVIAGERSAAYNFLTTQYAATGRKDEVLRIWKLYKEKGKVSHQVYISVITTLLKFNDLEGAEKILAEWESQNIFYDMLIPNFFIDAYSRKGLMEKAETLINRVISKGGMPNAKSWYFLASGYLQSDQMPKAVEAMRQAVTSPGQRWKPSNEKLAACLEYLKVEGDLEKAEGFIKLLRDNYLISSEVQQKLLNHIKVGNLNSDVVCVLNGDFLIKNGEGLGNSGVEDDRIGIQA